ncbi:MAG: hypothetical protein ACK4GK_03855 [Ferrovibrio sp.]
MPEQDQEKKNSVFDFLYVDHDRIGLYLSQFNNFGRLTSLTRSTDVSDKSDIRGKLPQILDIGSESLSKTGVSKAYDPRWVECLAFLDELQARDLIVRDLSKSAVGQFILANGDLSIIDIGTMQKALKHESIRKVALRGAAAEAEQGKNRHERRRIERDGRAKAQDDALAGIDLIADLPQTTQANLITKDGTIWCLLNNNGLIVPPTDITMKYGGIVEGVWHIIGILDAVPQSVENYIDKLDHVLKNAPRNQIAEALMQFAPQMHLIMGRPLACYGVTPLAIFRETNR